MKEDKKRKKTLTLKKFWRKVAGLLKANSILFVFLVVVIGSIGIIFALSRTLETPKAEIREEIKDDNSLDNPDRILIEINKDRISPSEIKIKANRFYDFEFRKSRDTLCNGVRVRDLDIQISIETLERIVPIRINSAGEYLMECIGESSSTKISVE